MVHGIDPHDLGRFEQAQAKDYDQALSEIRTGRKRSHWMWYVFPQFDGLGSSAISRRYAIKSLAEAGAYLRHPVLGPRLVECCEAVVGIHGRSAHDIFGSPDDMKLRSCATLFARVSAPGSVFERLLDKYFAGEADQRTLHVMGAAPEIRADIGPLLDELLGLGYRVVATQYSPEHFGNWVVDLAGPTALRLCRDRSQFIVLAERELLEPADLWRAYDDVSDFSRRVLAWAATSSGTKGRSDP